MIANHAGPDNVQSLSNNCRYFASLGKEWAGGGRWATEDLEKTGQMLDFLMSTYCPTFVQLQCDQVANVKVMRSYL